MQGNAYHCNFCSLSLYWAYSPLSRPPPKLPRFPCLFFMLKLKCPFSCMQVSQHGDDPSELSEGGYRRFLVDTPLVPICPTQHPQHTPASSSAPSPSLTYASVSMKAMSGGGIGHTNGSSSSMVGGRGGSSSGNGGAGVGVAAVAAAWEQNLGPAAAAIWAAAGPAAGGGTSTAAAAGGGGGGGGGGLQEGGITPSCGYGSFHQQYWLDGKLIAVGVVDVLPR